MHTSSVQQNLLQELDRELVVTRKVLERLPEDKFGFTPHPKSPPLIKLATHIVNLLALKSVMVRADYRDFADPSVPKPPPTPTTRAALLERFDAYADDLRKALAESDDERFTGSFQLRAGDRVMMDRPRGAALRIMGLNHSIHHRGQLTIYLRMLDVPVPGIYGPSADEPGEF
jgi:uncharacterized damage-inducible protein DinB